MIAEKDFIQHQQYSFTRHGVEHWECHARWDGHYQEQRRRHHQSDRDRSMIDARVVHRRRATNSNQMIDHTAVEHHHQHERNTVVHTQMNIVPHRIDQVLRSIGIDSAWLLVEATEQQQVEIESETQCDDADDDHQDGRGLAESGAMQATKRQVPVETDEHAEPCRWLADEIAEKADDLAGWDGIALESEAMRIQEVVIEIPSVEHDGVKNSDDAQIMHGGLFLGICEWSSWENEESEKIERRANDDQGQWVISKDSRFCVLVHRTGSCVGHDARYRSTSLTEVLTESMVKERKGSRNTIITLWIKSTQELIGHF